MERIRLLQQIYKRLAELEEYREFVRMYPGDIAMIDTEMNRLRLKLQDVMNSRCPLIKGA